MTDQLPETFHEGEFGYAPSVMFGGPIDGRRFKLPILPDGEVPYGFGHPLRQPHEGSPLAYYERVTDEPVGGFHMFAYQGLRGPGGRSAYVQMPEFDVPELEETEPGSTCSGYGPARRATPAERGE
jgi:hypothetical protein